MRLSLLVLKPSASQRRAGPSGVCNTTITERNVQSPISRTSNGLLSFRLLHGAEIRGLLDGKRCGCGCGTIRCNLLVGGVAYSPCMTDNGLANRPFADVQQNISRVARDE
jgi:hypothetical protein